MSMKTLESAVLKELRIVAKNNKIRLKDIMEWSTSEETVKENLRPNEEKLFHLPELKVWCAVKKDVL